ncbi:hypothetical protein O4220_13205 [Rhodococcus ruber]|uniref:Uncharacterized protein n=1 Tax=Rhodococcus ruber TaxID=1830 RepID=A0ABT4MGC3_9NOCA|nr:hypothetical protein [Rhodococcus ruber]MCZ4519475.1 hypothetical protein [Rhodococcus ruber]
MNASLQFGLERPDDFSAFSVALVGISDAELTDINFVSKVSTALGRVDGAHVHVRRSALEHIAGEAGSNQKWQAGLDSMIEFARTRGWIDAYGAIRAHVDSVDER